MCGDVSERRGATACVTLTMQYQSYYCMCPLSLCASINLASASIQADDLNLGLALVQPLVLLNLLRQQSLGSCASGRLRTAFARGQLVEASLVFAATFG